MGGWIVFMWVCYKGCIDVVDLFFFYGVNLSVIGLYSVYFIIWVVGRGYVDIVYFLL